MTELFCPEVISLVALLAGLIIGWLAREYCVAGCVGDDCESGEVDRQAWEGVRDNKGRFVKLI